MAAYHLAVATFPETLLTGTDRYFRQRPWRADWVTKAQDWAGGAADSYRIPVPRLRHTSASAALGSGCYLPRYNEIRLPHASVVTLFHELRHALQHHRPDLGWYQVDPTAEAAEDDARAWSLSLFHQVRPDRLAAAVAAGRVFYITPQDLT